MIFEADYFFRFQNQLSFHIYSAIKILQKSGDPNDKDLGVDSFLLLRGKKIVAWFLICFFRGDQLKVKLANHKFSKIGAGPEFLVFGVGLVIGGRDW